MFKKLQNLLFEDEDDDIDDEEEEEVEQPVRQRRPEPQPVRQKPAPQPRVVQETKSESSMQRIDVTQPIPAQKPQRPQPQPRNESIFRESEKPAVQEESKPKLGITVDEKPKPAKKKAAPAPKKKEEKKSSTPVYQFKPVISPIFGVDEKDMNALKNTTNKISAAEKSKNDGNITPIISPIYGTNEEDQPSMIQDTVAKSDTIERTTGNALNAEAEDDIPEFSLDDILKVRDEQFENALKEDPSTKKVSDDDGTAPLFPDLTLDEESAPEDQTVVLNRNDLRKDKK